MAAITSVDVLNQDFLNAVFCFTDLKQLCIVEQVSKLWETIAKNHSNWASFANKYGILVNEKPLKNLVILNRVSYCTHALKVLTFQEPCIPVIQFLKECKSFPSAITTLEMCGQIERTHPTLSPQTLLLKTLSLENCTKISNSDELIADIECWLSLGAVVDQNACDEFLYHERSFQLPEAAIYIINRLPDPSNLSAECTSFYLITYVLSLKKNKDFNVKLTIPEDQMARFENKSKSDYQEFIKGIPLFFQSGICDLLGDVGASFSDSEKELIIKQLNEFAQPLIEKFQPPQ